MFPDATDKKMGEEKTSTYLNTFFSATTLYQSTKRFILATVTKIGANSEGALSPNFRHQRLKFRNLRKHSEGMENTMLVNADSSSWLWSF